MSYFPFTPDVSPPPAESAQPPRSRAGRWAIGTLLYLAFVAGWVWWMLLPPPIQPPLASIPLPDGTELRIVHLASGPQFSFYGEENFGHRIRVPDLNDVGHSSFSTDAGAVWLVVAHFDPRTEQFERPVLKSITLRERTLPSPLSIAPEPRDDRLPYQVYYRLAVSPRTPTLDFEIEAQPGTIARVTLPNPTYTNEIRELKPLPLPQTVAVQDATLTLESVKFAKSSTTIQSSSSNSGSSSSVPVDGAVPKLKIVCGELRERDFQISYSFYDATGRQTARIPLGGSGGALDFSEPAWGLRVQAYQYTASPTQRAEAPSLGEFTVPAPGTMVALPVPSALAAMGITDLLIVGKGPYSFNAKTLTSLKPDAESPSTLSLSHPRGYGRETFNVPSLVVLSTKPREHLTEDAIFLARVGAKVVSSVTNSSSQGGSFYLRGIIFNTGTPAAFTPGTKATLLWVKPRKLTAKFEFPTPARPPAQK